MKLLSDIYLAYNILKKKRNLIVLVISRIFLIRILVIIGQTKLTTKD